MKIESVLKLIDLGWYVYPLHEILENGECSCQEYQRSEANRERLEKQGLGGRYDPEFVCHQPGKHPRNWNGLHGATNDRLTAVLWWNDWPNSGVGVNCGKSGLAVIDVDSYKNPLLDEAVEYYLGDVSRTVTSRTGGGGYHYIFKMPDGAQYPSSQVVLKYEKAGEVVYLEFKGMNGTFNAPPSPHPSGTPYRWERSPWDYEIEDLSSRPRIIEALEAAKERRAESVQRAAKASANGYNSEDDYELVREALRHINPMPGYATWRDMCFAVHSRWPGDDGVTLIEEWSPGYRGEVAHIFSSANGNGGVKLGSLFNEAKKGGFSFPTKKRGNTASKQANGTSGRKSPKAPNSGPGNAPQTKTGQDVTNEPDEDDTLDALGIDEVDTDLGYPPLRETWPYTVNNGRLVMVRVKKEDTEIVPIANFVARIAEQIDGENGDRSYVVRGVPLRGRPFEFEIDAIEFGKRTAIAAMADAAAGAQSAVVPSMAGHVGAAIKAISRDEKHFLKIRRTGWSKDLKTYFIDGRGDLEDVEFDLQNQMESYRVETDRSLDDGLVVLDHLFKVLPEKRMSVLLTAMLTAPMGQLVNASRYGVFVRGRSGTYKTSAVQAAMNLFGRFIDESSIIKAGSGATHNAMIALIAAASDAPIFLDNFKPNTQKEGQFAALIHAATEGREKNRLNQNSQQREARTLRSWLMMTGEDVPDNDGATMARMLVLPLAADRKSELPHLDYVQAHNLDLNAVGLAWIEWLEGEGRDVAREMWKDFTVYRVKWAKIVRGQREDVMNAGRIANNLATNELAFEIICKHPTIGPIFEEYREQHAEGLWELAGYMATETAESMEAVQFMAYLNAMLIDGTATLVPTSGTANSHDLERMVGYRQGDKVLIHMTNALRKVKATFGNGCLNGVKSTMLYAQIEALDIVPIGYPAKPKPMSINGRTQRLLALDAQKFDNYEQGAHKDEFEEIMDEMGV